MPVSNQLMSWDLIAAEVSAGRMIWSGSAQSGNYAISWGMFIANIVYDGTNPSGYASNQGPPYSYLLARSIVINPPATLSAYNAGLGIVTADWTAPSSGLAPTSYTVEFYQNSVLKQTDTGITSLTDTSSPGSVTYTAGDLVTVKVYSVNSSHVSTPKTSSFTF